MSRARTDGSTQQVAIEVSRSYLRMISIFRPAPNRPAEVRTRALRWRFEASSLLSDIGVEELTRAFKTLAADEKLTGKSVRLALSGEFCVTRVLTGTEERVRRELSQLEDRSQRYLTLGPGRKALAGSIRQIDARHQHALLTVSNEKTLETLLHVAATVGLQIELIEPSLVALSRVLGKLGYDRDQPTMIINVDEKGVELGISYAGQLLLDYRPGGKSVHVELVQILMQHMARLRRYCFRYFRHAQGELEKIYLCGEEEHLQLVLEGFAQQDKLHVAMLDLGRLDDQWRFAEGPPSSDLASALGTCLIPPGGDPDCPSPNLIENLEQQVQQSLWKNLLRVGWPVAAVLLLALGLLGLNAQERYYCDRLEAQLAAFETVQTQAREHRTSLARAETKQAFYQRIEDRLVSPDLNQVLETIGRCLPGDVWLEQMQIDRDGRVKLSGASQGEHGIYEFVNWLEKSPQFTDVALQGTGGRSASSQTTKFQVECDLENSADSAAKEESND